MEAERRGSGMPPARIIVPETREDVQMPIYDYRCNECQSTYDVFHKVREVLEDVVCPHCGSAKHMRLISAARVGKSTRAQATASELPPCADGNCCGGSCNLN